MDFGGSEPGHVSTLGHAVKDAAHERKQRSWETLITSACNVKGSGSVGLTIVHVVEEDVIHAKESTLDTTIDF